MALFENKDDIFELMDKFDKSSLSELEISTGDDFNVKLSKFNNIKSKDIPAGLDTPPDIIPDIYEEDIEIFENPKINKIIKAPLVGTFYASPSPDSEPYVKTGSKISKGMVICIIEAMKTMNEIESDEDGEIAEILVKDGSPVEYGQPLFRVK